MAEINTLYIYNTSITFLKDKIKIKPLTKLQYYPMVTELITAISECNCPGSAIISVNPEDYYALCLMSSLFLLPVQILRIEKKIPITKRTTSSQHGKKRKNGVRSFI